ncbi:hypothetical protein [Massilia sp. YMA4]|uniref:hypothetical protein n=1 Tax=Massilia sp. YMA4 TaxID=1593482 RepID=UPI000DD15B02|nr:hypothetical protein [Massilia sp. YMA4]AXA91577.1 hypothetical protein DPH57_10705 [Massilia sp. YMA4]
MRRHFGFLLLTLLAGCATYQRPQPAEQQATLAIDGQVGGTAATSFGVYDNACQRRNDASGSVAVTTLLGRLKQASIKAGAPLCLVATTNESGRVTSAYGRFTLEMNQCAVAVRFTPERNKLYDVALGADRCSVVLVEHDTGLPPAGAEAWAVRTGEGNCVEPQHAIALQACAQPALAAAHVPTVYEQVPYLPGKGQERFRSFLTKPLPHAFAILQNGYSVSVSGTHPEDQRYPVNPVQRALQMCREFAGRDCELYMVDDRIVFHRPQEQATNAH